MNRTLALITVPAICGLVLLSGCGRDPQSTGTEYAPQMYHSIPYEPYSQIVDTNLEDYNSNPYNENRINMRKPVSGSIKRKVYKGSNYNVLASDIMEYGIPHPDSIGWSERNVRNPIANSPAILEEGKALYLQFCSACHGLDGKAGGKVAAQYPGVANLMSPGKMLLNEGHIFHTITYGKGRMWPHGSQINPEDRWRIVRYIKDDLQKQK